jgi:glutathione synthase/RimK-type ligase-like ATP-grasp enzyme
LTPDDGLLAAALLARGIEPVPLIWNAADTDWGGFDGCLIRSVWDYHLEPERFLAWSAAVAAAVPTWNASELISWNADKTYLRELGRRGVPTIPTRWLRRGSEVDLSAILAAEGWEATIAKPTIDLGARNLRRLDGGDGAGQRALETLLESHDVMLQPFLPSLEVRGELSLVYCAGAFSHAARKLPASGDFRVQSNWGGTSHAARADRAELELGERVLAGLPGAPLYARVDLVEGPGQERYLIELELIDPNLYFGERPEAAGLVAAAIADALGL